MSALMIPRSAIYVSDYVTAAAEAELIGRIDHEQWRKDLRRRVQHYGYLYDYKARRISADSYLGLLPEWLARIALKLVSEGVFEAAPDQVIINEYLPGQGIAAHVDCEPCFGDIIASLSLGSACTMEFTEVRSGEAIGHYLEPTSLLVLAGESRFHWKHGIPARRSDLVDGVTRPRSRRISLTFRSVVRTL